MKNIKGILIAGFLLIQILACGEEDADDDIAVQQENIAPISNAGVDQEVNEETNVTLVGSGSDTDGQVVNYSWSQSNGVSVELSNATSSSSTFVAPITTTQLSLTFDLLVEDDDGATSSDSITVIVNPISDEIIVDAGENQTVNEQTQVFLTGVVTGDEVNVASVEWVAFGTKLVPLLDANSKTASFYSPALKLEKDYLFRFEVFDVHGVRYSDSLSITVKPTQYLLSGELNDTGITECASYVANGLTCSVDNFEGQDGDFGRDSFQNDDSDGHAGFSFTKVDANGNDLPADAVEWSCVRDNITELIWEVKSSDGGLHDNQSFYTWFDFYINSNGGYSGTKNGGTCVGSDCDTTGFVYSVNEEALCGLTNWYLPSFEQLNSLVDYSALRLSPKIDTNYFPNTVDNFYWSSSPYGLSAANAWGVNFSSGKNGYNGVDGANRVRIVSEGRAQ